MSLPDSYQDLEFVGKMYVPAFHTAGKHFHLPLINTYVPIISQQDHHAH
jgi:hypothetical protein